MLAEQLGNPNDGDGDEGNGDGPAGDKTDDGARGCG